MVQTTVYQAVQVENADTKNTLHHCKNSPLVNNNYWGEEEVVTLII